MYKNEMIRPCTSTNSYTNVFEIFVCTLEGFSRYCNAKDMNQLDSTLVIVATTNRYFNIHKIVDSSTDQASCTFILPIKVLFSQNINFFLQMSF